MNDTTRTSAPLTWARRLGYAMGDYGCNLYWQTISLFLYFYYTDILGISPLWAGIAFAVGSIYDALSDPVMGSIADRTRTRWGRYRPFLLWGAIPSGLTLVATFYIPPLSGIMLVLYATLAHILLRTAYTVVSIPYLAMSANLTFDSGERANIAGLRMVFAAAGAVTIALFVPRFTASLAGSAVQPYLAASIVIAIVATIMLLVCFLSTRENLFVEDQPPGQPLSWMALFRELGSDLRKFWGMLLKNSALARVFGAIVVVSVSLTMFSKCVLYWFKYGVLRPELTGMALMLPALMILLCAPFWVWFAKRFSKRDAWLFGSLFAAAGYVGFFLNQSASAGVTFAWIALIGIGTSAYAIMYWAMLPDTVEFNEWKLGERSEAKIVGFAAFAQKTALAINALVLGQALEWVGFIANQPAGTGTIFGIKFIMTMVPLAGVVASVLILWHYPITPKFHRQMLEELSLRDARAKA
jgi:glycoside/pentoside/hexuronide:cation symporter, GPH family